MRETHDDVLRISLMDFEELAVIHNALDDIVHVVSLVRIVRDDLVQCIVSSADRVICRDFRSFFHIVLRNVAQQFLYDSDAVLVIFRSEMCNTALGGMYAGSSEVFCRYGLTCDALHDCRTRKEHVGSVLHHDREVGQCR